MADIFSPVVNISNVFLSLLILLYKYTPGVVQNKPTFTPDTEKWARLDARAISQAATNWVPAAVANPYTEAITGIDIYRI